MMVQDAVDWQRLSDDRGRAIEPPLPQSVTDDRNQTVRPAALLIIGRGERPADQRRHT